MLETDQAGPPPVFRLLLASTPQRLAAFERALRLRVSPGDVVLDLGRSGVLAMPALRASARQVPRSKRAMPSSWRAPCGPPTG
jgi:hypothetical protein